MPRISVAYDPTGKGNQVVRAGFNMFTNNVGTSLADSANPNGTGYLTYYWNGSTIANSATPGAINSATPDYTQFAPACGANAPGTGGCLASGTYKGGALAGVGGYVGTTGGAAGYVDPNLKRPYSIEYNLGYQRTLMRNVSVGVAYYHRTTQNVQTTQNINAPAGRLHSDQRVSQRLSQGPADHQSLHWCADHPLRAHWQQPTLAQPPQPAPTTDVSWTETTNNPLVNQNHYNGVEFTVNSPALRSLVGSRRPHHPEESRRSSPAATLNDPNLNINRYGSIDQDSTYVVRADVTYKLPYRFQTSLNYQHETGYPIVLTNAYSGLAPGQITETVNLDTNGSIRYPSINDTNLRISRITSYLGALQPRNRSAISSTSSTLTPPRRRPPPKS